MPTEGDAALEHVLSGYVVDFLRRNPAVNTYLGGAGLDPSLVEVDATLRDFSPSALDQEDAWLRASQRAIEAVPQESLSPRARVDRQVALAQIRFLLHQQGVRRYQERALDTYVNEPFQSIDWQMARLSPAGDRAHGTPDEWSRVVRRLNTIPAFLAAARVQLEAGLASRRVPDWRMAKREGLETSEARARYFADELPEIAREWMGDDARDDLVEELRTAGREAAGAYRGFRDFIASAYFEDGVPKFGADRFAMGAEEYGWALSNVFRMGGDAWQAYDGTREAVDEANTDLLRSVLEKADFERRTPPADRADGILGAFDDMPKVPRDSHGAASARYEDAGSRLIEFIGSHELFDLSAGNQVSAMTIPVDLDMTDGTTVYQAPPLASGVDRPVYLARIHDDPVMLRGTPLAAAASTGAHHGVPGHRWYFTAANASGAEVSPVRWLMPGAVESSSSAWIDTAAVEGWAIYVEDLIDGPQVGPVRGFYTRDEHLYEAWRRLYWNVRARLDAGIHSGRIAYPQAVTALSETMDFLPGSCGPYIETVSGPAENPRPGPKQASCERAEREVYQLSKWPMRALTVRLGRDRLQLLRAQAVARVGEGLSLPRFHRLVIEQGPIPETYFHDMFLDELDRTGS